MAALKSITTTTVTTEITTDGVAVLEGYVWCNQCGAIHDHPIDRNMGLTCTSKWNHFSVYIKASEAP